MKTYAEMDLKLGIKSSLPNVKSTIALAILLWDSSGRPAELVYSEPDPNDPENSIVIKGELVGNVCNYCEHIFEKEGIAPEIVESTFNNNRLVRAQIESLKVAFELIWKLAKVDFVDTSLAFSAERTGKVRYPKKLTYSSNIDIIRSALDDSNDSIRVLLSWLGFEIPFSAVIERMLEQLLTVLSETAVFKLLDGKRDVIFNQNSIYLKLLKKNSVEVSGDNEPKGSLRILHSILAENMHPYLKFADKNKKVLVSAVPKEILSNYQKRVDTFLSLNATKVIGLENSDEDAEDNSSDNLENTRIPGGTNILLYGVPGSGKSWTIEHEYRKPESEVVKLVFHPDYTYSDFVGQILPNVDEDGQVSYKFTPGPFTKILRDSYNNPKKEYLLIIEEINRGNAPAIFGEAFQLLDRKVAIDNADNDDGFPVGTSEYGIKNTAIAAVVYGADRSNDEIRIPSNLSIIGTMNTSDQNVFTLDTAFQRRWNMRLIENSFDNVAPGFANALILDTGVRWEKFCTEINKIVVNNGIGVASTEDKRLGTYFVHPEDLFFDENMGDLTTDEYRKLCEEENDDAFPDEKKERLACIRKALKQNRKFSEKVIKYLWDDAFKFNREMVFNCTEYKSLEDVIRAFMYAKGFERFKIFLDNVRSSFRDANEQES